MKNSFEKNGYQIVRNFLKPQTLKILSKHFEMVKDVNYLIRSKSSNEFLGDEQTPSSFAHYAAWGFEALLEAVRPDIEKIVNKELYPTYSYARIYYKGSTLEKHTDRESCEYSVTACIKNDESPWDIYFEDRKGKEIAVTLEEGDIVIYRGYELPHWRNSYEGNKQIQSFLHYVDVHGPFSEFKYDHRPMLGMAQGSRAIRKS